MKPWRILTLACAGVCALAQAQGLGEAAAKEKQRREQEQKKRGTTKVITTDELVKVGTSEAPAGGLLPDVPRASADLEAHNREGARRREGGGRADPEGKLGAGRDNPEGKGLDAGNDEEQWKQRANSARQAVKDAEGLARQLDEKAGQAFGQLQRSTDTNEMMRLREEIQGLNEQIEQAKAGITAARQALQDLAEEARKAGVPAGWVR